MSRTLSSVWVLAAGLIVLLTVVPVATGVPLVEAVIWTSVIVVQAGGGVILWRFLAGPSGPVELMGMGLALGTAIAVVPGTLLAPLPGGSVLWSCIPAAGAVVAAHVARLRNGPIAWCRTSGHGSTPALAIGALLGLGAFSINVRAYPLGTGTTWSTFHSDMPYFEALATSFARYGPWDSLLADGFVLRYHALAYSWAGTLTEAANAGPFASLTRALPLVATVGTVLIAIAWSQRLDRSRWLPSISVLVLLAGGYLGATYGSVLNFDSPSQSIGAMWLMALIVLATSVRPQRRAAWVMWAATITIVTFALTGGKVSSAAVGVAGLMIWAIVAVMRRERSRRAVVAATSSIAGAVTAFLLLLAGAADAGGLVPFAVIDRASSQQGLNPMEGSIGVVGGTLVLALAIASRWAGVVWLTTLRRWRWRPEVLTSLGMMLASLGAMLVFNGGLNETWFAAGASGPLAVTTSLGAILAFRWIRSSGSPSFAVAGVFIAILVVLATAATWMLWLTGPSGGNVWVSTARWAAPIAGIAVAALGAGLWAARSRQRPRWRSMVAVTVIVVVGATASMRALGAGTGMAGQQPGFRGELFSLGTTQPISGNDATVLAELNPEILDAAEWARQTLPVDALMASSLTFSPIIPALTARQSFVSGLQFQVPYGLAIDASPLLARDALVSTFMKQPGAATIAPLCAAGVSAVWLSAEEARRATSMIEPVFDNGAVVIARPQCTG